MAYAQKDTNQIYIVDRPSRTTTYEIVNDGNLPNGISPDVFTLVDVIRAGTARTAVIAQTLNSYDGAAFSGLGFGNIGDYGALVRAETLVLTTDLIRSAYETGGTAANPAEMPPYFNPIAQPAWTAEYPSEFRNSLPSLAGYVYRPGGAGSSLRTGYFAVAERRR